MLADLDEQAGLQRDWNLFVASYLGLRRSKYEIWSSELSNLKQLEDSGNYANKGIVSSSNRSRRSQISRLLAGIARRSRGVGSHMQPFTAASSAVAGAGGEAMG